MSMAAIIGAVAVIGCAVAAELMLRRAGPYRLWSDAFDEASIMLPHPRRGWKQKPGHSFRFHHRYLKKPVDIALNDLGMRDGHDYEREKPAGTFRVLLMGGTTSAGWELEAHETQAAQLQQKLAQLLPDRRIEVMNGSGRLYSTGQLYNWYVEELAIYKPDLVIYYFNINHPRRTASVHESGKSPLLSQPVYRTRDDGKLNLQNDLPG